MSRLLLMRMLMLTLVVVMFHSTYRHTHAPDHTFQSTTVEGHQPTMKKQQTGMLLAFFSGWILKLRSQKSKPDNSLTVVRTKMKKKTRNDKTNLKQDITADYWPTSFKLNQHEHKSVKKKNLKITKYFKKKLFPFKSLVVKSTYKSLIYFLYFA